MERPAALSRPPFRALAAAGVVSDTGDWLLFIALPIVVYTRTGSALGTAGAFLAQLAPAVALAPLGGRLADRADRRTLLLALTALQALSLVPLLVAGSRATLGLVYATIAVHAGLQALFEPAENALLPALVPDDELVSANALVGLGEAVARLAGGPLGGVLLAVGHLEAVLGADLASYLLAGALIARVRIPAAAAQAGTGAEADRLPPAVATPSARRGLRAVLDIPPVRAAVVLSGAADVAQGIFLVLFVVFVARRLHGGAGETGLLRGVQAIGSLTAGLGLALLARRRSPAALVAGAALVFGVLSLLIWNLPALTAAPVLYGALFAAAGAPAVVMQTGMASYLQQASGDAYRGRVFALFGLAENLGQALGMVLAGTLTATVGLGGMLNFQGLVYVAVALAAARWLTAAARENPVQRLGPEHRAGPNGAGATVVSTRENG